ncbi:unnamed protein product [Penicillium bialowiezense]
MKNQCFHCNERFDHYVQLSRHVAESHGDKPVVFRCILTDCPWESDSVDAARQHARTKHYRQRAYPIEDEDGVFECEECTHCCDTITSFDVHGQADHPRSYWPVLHDVQTIGVGFPHGIFFCGLCSAPYTDAMKARHHLAEKHPALVLQIHHADVTRIDAISMYRCPGYTPKCTGLVGRPISLTAIKIEIASCARTVRVADPVHPSRPATPKRKRGNSNAAAGPSRRRRPARKGKAPHTGKATRTNEHTDKDRSAVCDVGDDAEDGAGCRADDDGGGVEDGRDGAEDDGDGGADDSVGAGADDDASCEKNGNARRGKDDNVKAGVDGGVEAGAEENTRGTDAVADGGVDNTNVLIMDGDELLNLSQLFRSSDNLLSE